MTRSIPALGVVAALTLCAGVASAQTRNTQSRPAQPSNGEGRGGPEVSIGAAWFGANTFADVEATQVTPGGTVKPVARLSTTLDASVGLAARVGVPLTARLAAEGAVSLSPTHLTTSVSDDVEDFPDLSAAARVSQYLFEGGLRWRVGALRPVGVAPFLSVGGGYLRQLHDAQTLAATGRSFYVGGGGHYPFRRGSGWIQSAGIRFDIRVSVLSAGVATDEVSHAALMAGAGLFIRF